jgi:hypothetical protein
MGALYVALMHGQVVNKTGEEIASALTHFDVHDIARTCRTYGVARYYVVTPLETMRYLAQRMVSYWNAGLGAKTVPNRKDALEIVQVATDLAEVLEDIEKKDGALPRTVVTSARDLGTTVTYEELRTAIKAEERPVLVIFGTAYGLSPSVTEACENILPPIRKGSWNHLSVRSAVAITLERLVGEE